ncbi:DNA glycosylase [Aureobasidium pullulans]|uniref:DNA glycosylase n=1 Tax=Aureobasidium pullulans TaxID=5580 RepID=A0A4S9CSG4_AURPU|nr:DNA glycosylase [Aureobasidium pullulans]
MSEANFKTMLQQYAHKGPDVSPTKATPARVLRSRARPASVAADSQQVKNKEQNAEQSKDSSTIKPSKKRKAPSKYAPPSKYQHLSPLTDILAPNLIAVFVGTNPGIRTAAKGHAYAHPSNQFWKLLHSSGCTDERLRPEQDVELPARYLLGNTNIVERPTKDAAELSKAEMSDGAPVLDEKCRKWRPECVCIVGKGIWEAIFRYRHGKNPTKAEFHWGWQDETENMGRVAAAGENGYQGAKVFVTTSTSGLAASLKPAEKEAIWLPFGEWCKERRAARSWPPPPQREDQRADESNA